MNKHLWLVWLTVATLLTGMARADDGHNHDAAPAAPAGPALPRFSAASDLFEMVGVVDGKRLTLYVDRYIDNSPVRGAKVELEVGGAKVTLQEHEPGEFEGSLADTLKPGVTAVTATVIAAADSDILAGEIDVHEDTHEAPVAPPAWRQYMPWLIGAVVVVALIAFGVRRSATAGRARFGGAA